METTTNRVSSNTRMLEAINKAVKTLNRTISKAKIVETEGNSYTHSTSTIKNLPRTLLFEKTFDKFPPSKYKTLRTIGLGGELLSIENMFAEYYKLKGVSYEIDFATCINAEKNKPKGIDIIYDDIFNHKYTNEHFIWFDLTSVLNYKNVNKLLHWINRNAIKNDCIFSVTYTLSNRGKGQGYKQLFGTDENYSEFIKEMANYIGLSLENEFVKIGNGISIIRYKNVDTNARNEMVQFIFNLSKR